MKLRDFFLLPALLWFVVFILAPLLIVIVVSFATRGTYGGLEWSWTWQNYPKVFSGAYLGIFLESLWLAAVTTVLCLVLGVLVAWAMATSTASLRSFYVMAIALPFLTNLVIRIYAIRVFVGVEGPLQLLLTTAGIPFDPFALTQNKFLVLYGMVTTYLPFMVLPLYGAFEKLDFSLVEAAQDLGAGPWRTLTSVILPNLKNALWSGSLLVFIPSLGEYVIPDLLGGAKNMLFGNLITEQFLKARNWPFGAALSVLFMLLLLTVVVIAGMRRARE
ncbi:MAG: spermidine/putrescine ABC transporter permease [Bdellovibrio sp. ArHS]|uniref:ABC transporter permease n=1 Tax=Bdellovibrio sp. ArHS TaxID=1569284 RepID=UPI000583424D|nr:ABC transporter permease [Bdellovibrio sp. ArHS]KHD87521.1 MAG: spermidine/putrescine ABC transporter permease [Bdellovibrio sp. ArHS]